MIVNPDKFSYEHQENNSRASVEELRHKYDAYTRFYWILLRPYLPKRKGIKILDLPCGEGTLTYMLWQHGYNNVFGYDMDHNRIKTGSALNLPIYTGDVFKILAQQQNDSVDVIFSLNFLEHLEKQDVIKFLALVYEKLSPGGRFFVLLPSADSPFGIKHIFNDFTHKWAATAAVIERLFRSIGFCEVSIFGEHPRIGMRYGIPRVILFYFCTSLINLFLRMINQKYEIWSPSMWAIASKKYGISSISNEIYT